MPEPTPDQSLHLPSLVIKNFRGIDELTIPRLGRVTLLVGKNGVGKTTVLDAVRIWATRGHRFDIAEVLHDRDEVIHSPDEQGKEVALANWDGLFFGRRVHSDETILIGPDDEADFLQMRIVALDENEISNVERRQSVHFDDEEILALRVKFRGAARTLLPHGISVSMRMRRRSSGASSNQEIFCARLGPDVPDNETIEQYLNALILTPDEERAIEALNLVADSPAERVALVDSGTRIGPRAGRRSIVKLNGQDTPVPLRSLGDGAVRSFAIALTLAASTDGFLLIDEAENGIHHSIQAKFWNMVLQTAERNNVQVIATTHSWDCVVGFAKAANELADVEGVLYRIQRNRERLSAVEYPESELEIAAEHHIEVR
ncbi:MAG: AAA family ATPase [Chloroflexota bacterium]|nr:AAA family ATPase [Chloroflexota bacterium]MDE2962236.1 AAA family ATPase [Chloroflexota bacterium]